MSSPWQQARAYGVHALSLGCLALMHLKLCYRLDQAIDLSTWDETVYLRRGIELLQRPPPSDGLFYYAWYYDLHRLIPDPIALCVINNALLIGAPAYLAYALLCRLGCSSARSLLAAGLFLMSPTNAVTWPYITRFALCLLLLCALLLTVRTSVWVRAGLTAAVSFVLGYVRPEYMVLFGCVWCTSLVLSLLHLRRTPFAAGSSLLWLAALAGLTIALGNPYTLSRSRVAFSQHFALSQTRSAMPPGYSPWYDAGLMMRRHFGASQASLGEALRANPRAVLRHVSANLGRLVRATETQLLPYERRPSSAQLALIQLALALLALRWLRRLRRPALQAESTWVWALLGAYALTGIASALLLFPRDHYLLIPTCIGFAWAAELSRFDAPWLRSPRWQGLAHVAMAAVLLWFTPFQLSGPAGITPHAPSDVLAAGYPSLRNRIRELATLPLRGHPHLLSAYPELPLFLPQLQASSLAASAPTFGELLEREHVELIWLDDELAVAHGFARRDGFGHFVEDPARYGFSVRQTGIAGERLYVKRGTLDD